MDGEKAAQFVECIDSMHMSGPSSSLLQYTREWVDRINRGGLFYVSDSAYNFFVATEMALQVVLMNHIHTSYKLSAAESRAKKAAIVDDTVHNEDVLFHYHILAVDIKREDDALELLKHVTELWLTIRGFAMAKKWMEEYKQAAQVKVAEKALRKDLKKKEQKRKERLSEE